MKPTSVETRNDLAAFVRELSLSTDQFHNDNLEFFLDGLAAFIGSLDGYLINQQRDQNEVVSWQLIAEMLDAARNYD